MESADFKFLERLLHRCFQITDVLYTQLQSVGLNITSANKLVETQMEKLAALDSDEKYQEMIQGISSDNISFDAREELTNVVWGMTEELSNRFESLSELTFLNLLDRKVNIEPLVDALMSSPYGHLFDKGRLLSDLTFFRDSPELGEDPVKVINKIYQLKMNNFELKELTKVIKLILTIPLTSVSCERSFSALKRIKSRLRTNMLDKRLCHLALLEIEADRTDRLSTESLVDHFATKERNIRLK